MTMIQESQTLSKGSNEQVPAGLAWQRDGLWPPACVRTEAAGYIRSRANGIREHVK